MKSNWEVQAEELSMEGSNFILNETIETSWPAGHNLTLEKAVLAVW